MSAVGFVLGVVLSCVSAYPAIHHHGHMHKRQSYARSNQLPSAQEPYGQSSYNNYNYYGPRSQSSGYYNGNGFGQPGHYQQYDYSPQYNHAYGREVVLLQNYPYPTSRYSSGVNQGHYQGAPGTGNSNQFLNYDQIVGAQPPRYASGSPSRGQPWSVQIGTQLKVNDDGKGPNSGSRYYVRDERNTRPRQPPPPYRK
ncbi:hypothetical protein Ocin01_10736 [Orchesella cincta]|uniref:Uncharacterized protein n=1 Tax=Orchesella cincta TaxID=48709 RepID=A0A1D2MS47_ORCCI|nr:hypothetical protein Ocin01_10736 [Orchesella cincta]